MQGDVAGLFEFAGMRPQVAVAHVEQGFQFVERELFVGGEGTHDAEAHPLVDQPIEAAIVRNARYARHRRRLGF